VVKTPDGFIVLVNSGAVTVLQQVSHLIVQSDNEKPMDFESNANAVAGVTEIIAEYLRSGDPFYGPRPFSVGQSATLESLLSIAALKFVIAHEYAHVLAGHFTDASPAFRILSTKAGVIEVLKKQWEQELEADDLGYRLSLGLEKYEDIDLTVIDRGFEKQEHIMPAVKLKCAIAGPFLLFTIAHIIERVRDAAGESHQTARTHPPADLRFEKLLAPYGSLGGRYSGYISLPVVLWEGRDRIVEGVLSKVAR
jgi:hypothetical protein